MKIFLISLALFGAALAGSLQDDVNAIQAQNLGESINRNTAKVDKTRKTIDSSFGGIEGVPAQKASVQALVDRVNLAYGNSKKAHAGAAGNLATANLDGQPQASATKFGNAGGFAKVGSQSGNIKYENTTNNHHNANVSANGKYNLDTQAQRDSQGNLDKFTADGEKHDFAIDPLEQTESQGHGTLLFKDEEKSQDQFWLYEIQGVNENEATALLSEDDVANDGKDEGFMEQLFARRQKKYRCQVKKLGESVCYDQNGKTVGKTVATDDGEVIVFNNMGLPVTRAKIYKDTDTKYRAVVNDGLMEARTTNIQEYDCFKEMTGRDPTKNLIEIQKPLTFDYNSQKGSDGSETYSFPDCFQIGANVKLAPGIEPWRIATEYVVNVLPVGKLRCMDVASCGRECYYCDLCNKTNHKLDLLSNSEGNVCSTSGGGTRNLKMTVCPPPEAFNWALCSKFSKSVLEKDYWQKKGDVDVQLRFYLRPLNQQQLEDKFYEELQKPFLGGLFRSGLVLEWLQRKGLSLGSVDPSNTELKEFYVQKNSQGGDKLIGCHRAVIKYELTGSKVDSSFLIEASSSASALTNVFKEKPCADWSKLQQEQYEREAKEAQERKDAQSKPAGGLFGGWFGSRT